MAVRKLEPYGCPFVFPPVAEQQMPTAGLEETLNVYWNDHSYYSRYRITWRLQRHRRRPVLWHRILWRRRPWPHRPGLADPAIARKALSFKPPQNRSSRMFSPAFFFLPLSFSSPPLIY